jgi:hypothetical protein
MRHCRSKLEPLPKLYPPSWSSIWFAYALGRHNVPSDAISAPNLHRTSSEADLTDHHKSPTYERVLFHIGLFLLIAMGFALATQSLVGAPH